MDTNLIKPYEISIWGTDESSEYKIAVIGSDQMSALSRACSPHFMRKSNGEKQLDFLMYTRYWDNEVGDFVDNPFIKLMCNERIVKLKYEDKWHDFIIKQIVENSDKKSYTYTAKDRFVQELGKTGFEIELDTELENNQGTNTELAAKVLAGTDWEVDEKNSDIIEELLVEPLFVGVLGSNIVVKNLRNEKKEEKEEEEEIEAGQTVYLYYKQLVAKETETLSIIYDPTGYVTDQDRVIIKNKNNEPIDQLYVLGINDNNNIIPFEYKKEKDETGAETGIETIVPSFINDDGLVYSTEYRGARLVRAQKSLYDANLGRYVDFYKDNNDDEYACFTETEYIMPETLVNLITNGSDFKNTSGWLWGTDQTVKQVFIDNDGNIYEPNSTELDDTSWKNLANIWLEKDNAGTLKPGLKISSNGGWIVNTGLKDSRNIIESIAPGDTYILKFDSPKGTVTEICIGKYKYISEDNLYDFENTVETEVHQINKNEYKIVFQSGISKEELSKNKYGFGITTNGEFYITNIQFFKKVNKIENDGSINSDEYYYPGETENFSAIIKQYYNLYEYDQDATFKPEEFVPIFRLENLDNYTPVYNDKFTKVRSISAKESNRFNLLQEICEKFECWMELHVEHDDIGAVKPNSKKVVFKEYVGQENDAGFRYGINLKSIQRTLDSNQITTKLIVKSNTNEFGKNGFCTIARASENPTGENFLLDFDYYTRHNLLSSLTLGKDLYEFTNSPDIEINEDGKTFIEPVDLCYYQRLKVLNENAQKKTEDLASIVRELDEIDAEKQVVEAIVSNAEELIADLIKSFNDGYRNFQEFINYLDSRSKVENLEDWDDLDLTYETAIEDSAAATICQQIIVYEQQIRENKEVLNSLLDRYQEAENKYNKILDDLNIISNKKIFLNGLFFKKYASFIQEGTWNSEDYYDDNLYYLDAENTLYNSAFPKVTYSINVVEISALTGYEGYSVDVGDRTYIEDIEFFGYGENGRPYQEEIVVNQLDKYLDEPTKDKISVKNYKNQFEDLFQRITAQTQSLQYHEGEYARSAATVLPGGNIDEGALSDTLANNNLLLSIGKNKSLTWNSDGFTNINPKVRSEMVQITGGAIRLTSDGGNTWGTAITGAGINAKYIKTGQLDTSLIRIMNGDNAAFRWDKSGITGFNIGENGVPNPLHFVRLDQYGLYGFQPWEDMKNSEGKEYTYTSTVENPWSPQGVSDVINYTRFGVTQEGLHLRDANGNLIFKNTDVGLRLANDATITSEDIILELIKPDADFNEKGLKISKGVTSIYAETLGGTISEKIIVPLKNLTSLPGDSNLRRATWYIDDNTTISNQMLLFNKINNSFKFGNQQQDKGLPGFALTSLANLEYKDIKRKNKIAIYGSSFGNVDPAGEITFGKGVKNNENAQRAYSDANRGFLMLSYHSDDEDAGGEDSSSRTAFMKINCYGIQFHIGNTYFRIGSKSPETGIYDEGVWYNINESGWHSISDKT